MQIDDVTSFLSFYLPHVPLCVIWLAAAILSFLFWSRNPHVSLLTLLAAILLLLQAILGTVIQVWLIRTRIEQEWAPQKLASYLGMLTVARVLMSSSAWILVLFAIFGWRRAER